MPYMEMGAMSYAATDKVRLTDEPDHPQNRWRYAVDELAPGEGLEPPTQRLTAACSTG